MTTPCAVCAAEVAPDDLRACPACSVVTHRRCRVERGECPSPDCPSRAPRPPRPTSRKPLIALAALALVAGVAVVVARPSNARLIDSAAFGDPGRAEAARTRLVERGAGAVPELIAALEHPDQRARAAAAILDDIGEPVVEPARAMLREGTDRQVGFAAIFLLRRHDRAAFAAILERARSATDPDLRRVLHLCLYGLSSDQQGDYSPQGEALLVMGIHPSEDIHGALQEVLGKAERTFSLEAAPAWLERHRAELPPQF